MTDPVKYEESNVPTIPFNDAGGKEIFRLLLCNDGQVRFAIRDRAAGTEDAQGRPTALFLEVVNLWLTHHLNHRAHFSPPESIGDGQE